MRYSIYENILKRLLTESITAGLAGLYENAEEWGFKAITIYKPEILLKNPNDVDKAVVGYISIQKPKDSCLGAWEVKKSGGRGYGAQLYGAMFAAANSPLIPDRAFVSDKARAGWEKQTKRRSANLDSNNPKHTKRTPDNPNDDCKVHKWTNDEVGMWSGDPILDKAYYPLGNEKKLLEDLITSHEQTMNSLTGISRKDVEIEISKAGYKKSDLELYGS